MNAKLIAGMADRVRGVMRAMLDEERADRERRVLELHARIDELTAQLRAIPAGPQGEPGRDGERGPEGPQGPVGERGAMGERGIDGRDGREGKDGRDGKDSDITRAELEAYAKAEVTKAMDETLRTLHMDADGRTLKLGDVVVAKFANVQYRGVWTAGTYEPGDVVAWGGQSYVCVLSTTDKPDQNTDAWKMLARKGRDGKDRA